MCVLQVHGGIKYAVYARLHFLQIPQGLAQVLPRSAGKESTSIRKNWMLAPNFLPAHLRGLKASCLVRAGERLRNHWGFFVWGILSRHFSSFEKPFLAGSHKSGSYCRNKVKTVY